MRIIKSTILLGILVILSIRCSDKSTNNTYNPIIDPADFVSDIDNQYWPLIPGTTFIYEGDTDAGHELNQMTVTDSTKIIIGVTCRVIHDIVWVDSELVEETYDWYAQDSSGDVWYFGEDSKEYADSVVISTEGSWEAGVDGALPGIIMEGSPRVGDSYRQEYYEGEAEDFAEILSLTDSVSIDFGDFANCIKTREWTPLEPAFLENKYYAPGIGLVLEDILGGGSGQVELVEIITQ